MVRVRVSVWVNFIVWIRVSVSVRVSVMLCKRVAVRVRDSGLKVCHISKLMSEFLLD